MESSNSINVQASTLYENLKTLSEDKTPYWAKVAISK